jgi:hypothetical protein
VFPVVQGEAGFASGGLPTAEDAVFPIDSGDTSPCVHGVVIENCSALHLALSRRQRQHRDLRQHAREQPTPCCRNQKPVRPVPQAKSAAVAIASQSIEVSASRSGRSKPVATVAS